MEDFGYVAQKYLAIATNNEENTENNKNEITNEIVRVICSGLRIRKEPGTDKIVSGYAEKGETLTRVEQAVSNANGYIWDKVVTSNGIEGYIARGDSNENYIEVVSVIKIEVPNNNTNENGVNEENQNNNQNEENKNNENVNNENTNNENTNENTGNKQEEDLGKNTNENTDNKTEDTSKKIEDYKNDKMKIESDNLICVPEAKVEDLKELFTDKEVKVINKDEIEVLEGNLATGYVIKIDDKTYNVVKLGDTNGDGKINSGDLFSTQKYLLKQLQFSDIFIKACDVNKDNKINSGDLFYIQKYLLKQTKLTI